MAGNRDADRRSRDRNPHLSRNPTGERRGPSRRREPGEVNPNSRRDRMSKQLVLSILVAMSFATTARADDGDKPTVAPRVAETGDLAVAPRADDGGLTLTTRAKPV